MNEEERMGGWRVEGRRFVQVEPANPFISPCQSTYDLNSTSPVTISNGITPTVVIKAFEEGPIHMFSIFGNWKLDEAARDHREIMLRSKIIVAGENYLEPSARVAREQRLLKKRSERFRPLDSKDQMRAFILQHSPKSFLLANEDRIIAYCTTPDEAENLAADFASKYERETPRENGNYVLIRQTLEGIDTHNVALQPSMKLDEARLALHYGKGFLEWHHQFVALLGERPHGISIFEGSPGTGKTYYIRHLLCELEETHRFYFLSPSQLDMLSRPDFIDFWLRQSRMFSDRRFVIILEDAENALMVRGTDNSKMVSTILNLTDGIMTDFLKLQFICTINCRLTEIDSALLRPGRLLSHRNFRKLDLEESTSLADRLGKTLPNHGEFSLAEIFADAQHSSMTQLARSDRKVGFGG